MGLATRSWLLLAGKIITLSLAASCTAQPAPATAPAVPGGIPVQLKLDKAAYVTLVVEDAAGHRVRNLIAETRFAPGANKIIWDGYDDAGKLVSPGAYHVRGLTHDGIRLYYEFAYNTAGNPPWFTPDHSGAWMADHSLPAAAVFLPAGVSPYGNGKPQVLLSGIVCESGDPTIFVDTTGQKVYGNHYFGWDGAVAAARDLSPKTKSGVFVYNLMGWRPRRIALRGITTAGQGVEIAQFEAAHDVPREPANIGLSVAVYDGLAAVSVPVDDELVFIDTQARKVLNRVPLAKPMGLAFDNKGVLCAITGTQIKRFTLTRNADTVSLSGEQVVVPAGLESPYALTLDPHGNIFVTDRGQSHQVKVFSPAGALLRTIGRPGGPQLGHYDDQRMQNPEGLAIDDRGQLWVAEFDALPKRVSIWNAATGALVKGLYGPPMYGGGGTIDAEDKTRLFYAQYGGLTEWQLDWTKGEARLKNICVRRSEMGTPDDIFRWHQQVGERPVHLNGRTYLIPTYSGFLRHNDNAPVYLLGDDGVAWPVAFVGTLRRWGPDGYTGLADVMKLYPKEPGTNRVLWDDVMVAWSDRNFDHKVQTDEFTIRNFPDVTFTSPDGKLKRTNRKEACQYFPDLSTNLRWMAHIDAPKFDARGVPLYDLRTVRFRLPPRPDFGGAEEGRENFTTKAGLIMHGPLHALDSQGQRVWSYPVLNDSSSPQKGGDINEPTRILGPLVVAKSGQAGEWYALSGERGNIFLMTTDGLFIQTLGGHMRVTPMLRYPQAKRGMLIDSPEQHVSFEDEHFHPSITQTRDGEIFLCAGKEHSSIFRVDGFNAIRRIALPSVEVTAASLAGLPEQRATVSDRKLADKLPVLIGDAPMTVDGDLADWPQQTAWASLDVRASAAIRVVGDTLYAAYRTGDPHAIDNDTSNYRFMFKTGGALDLQVRPDADSAGVKELMPQDRRLLIAKVRGKFTAALFYPETAGTSDAQKVVYESPIGKVRFDKVVDVSSQVKVMQKDGNFEVAVPLAVLGLQAKAGRELLGDIGIIRGNGTQNIQRLYWHNTNTALVSDIPSEARLTPVNWGRFKLVAERKSADGTVLLAPEKARRVGTQIKLKKLAEDEYAIGFWSDPADYLEWTDVPVKPGRYTVELTYACGNNVGNGFVFAVGNQSLAGKTRFTGGWTQSTSLKMGEITLTGDRATFTLKATSADSGLMDMKGIELFPIAAHP